MGSRCQQFTSINISNNMLDMINYKENLFGKKVIENSCGEGNILTLIVERYIIDANNNGISNDLIKKGLENDIYGAEIVSNTYNICIENLNNVAAKYKIHGVKWNILNGDILKKSFSILFDYVIGNPPYISYRDLKVNDREFIKTNFETCKLGKPDYCYAFIENAINYLADGGKMIYLIPNSIFKNVFAKCLRDMIKDHLVKIYDYPNQKLFENALTSSALMILQKNSNMQEFEYYNVTKNIFYLISKSNLENKWAFIKETEADDKVVSFNEFFKASITIATQRNKIFVVDCKAKDKYKIENRIVRKAISPRNMNTKNIEYIIFPYKLYKAQVIKYQEMEFKIKYPKAYQYLEENREELEKRQADIKAQWFEYGRSQAIQNMSKMKLLVSTIVTKNVNVYNVERNEIPYSGIYIIANEGYNLEIAKIILQSKEFLNYVRKIGTPASGSSVRITADDINNYKFLREEFF